MNDLERLEWRTLLRVREAAMVAHCTSSKEANANFERAGMSRQERLAALDAVTAPTLALWQAAERALTAQSERAHHAR